MGTFDEAARRWAGPALILAAGGAMLAWSWGTWPDVQIDFGQQLYVAWQISEGRLLYRDLAWHHGALPAYLNATWFRLFGVSLGTLVICNLVLLTALVALTHRVLTKVAGATAATVGALVLLSVFAFGQQVSYGNYNFVTPYEHGVLHGILLSVAALLALARHAGGGGPGWLALCGLATGLVFLTKAEVFLALVAGLGTPLVAGLIADRAPPGRWARVPGALLLAAVAPVGLTFAFFRLALPGGEAAVAALGSWPAVLGADPGDSLFHRRGLGVLDVGRSLRQLANWSAGYALVFVPAAAAALAPRESRLGRIGLAVAPLLLLLLFLSRESLRWVFAVRPLPVLLAAAAVAAFAALLAARDDLRSRGRRVLTLGWIVFSLALLSKMILNVRTNNYGFALAMPATLTLVAILVAWIPDWISRRGGRGGYFRAVSLAALFLLALGHLETTARHFERKIHPVARGGDRFRADFRGLHVDRLLVEIERRVAPDETLAVLPDGAMVNYLSRRASSVPYTFFAPIALRIYGEDEILASFRSHPPDWVVLMHKSASEFGFRFIGDGYGEPLMGWIRRNYRPVVRLGHPPFRDKRWGVELRRRVSPGPQSRERGIPGLAPQPIGVQ